MSRQRLDAVIVGGGVVGAATALGLARAGLQVALVEARAPRAWSLQQPDLRVYALAPDNAALLQALGVWPAILSARAQPYRRMRIWDAACDRAEGELVFDADRFGRGELGWIVENDLLVDRLWAALPGAGVQLHCPATVEALEQDAGGVRLRLDDGRRLEARVAVAADGGASALRRLAGFDLDAQAYGQRGVVAFVQTGAPHADTAWQRFLPTGPLAVLPFTEGRSSIVWTLPEDEAQRIAALDDDAFARELTNAFAARLGPIRPLSPRVGFPLRLQFAHSFVRGRVLLVGDAAHVVHPLAGQGVNLGLRDVAALLEQVRDAQARRADWTAPHRLRRWAQARRSDAVVSGRAFDGINRLYSNAALPATLLRGPLLGLAGRLPPLARALWGHAAGV